MASLLSRSVVVASLSAIAALLGGCGGGGGGGGDEKCEATPLSKPTAKGLPIPATLTIGFEGLDDTCCSSVKSGINSAEDCLKIIDDVNKTQKCLADKEEDLKKMKCLASLPKDKTVTTTVAIEKASSIEQVLPAFHNLHEPVAFLQDLIAKQGMAMENASAVIDTEQTDLPQVGATCSPNTFTTTKDGVEVSADMAVDGISDACCKQAKSTISKVEKSCLDDPKADCFSKACDSNCTQDLAKACIDIVIANWKATITLKVTNHSKVQRPRSVDVVV